MSVLYKPEKYHSITPYILLQDVPGFIAFTEKALGANVFEKIERDDGIITHAEIMVEDSPIMMGTPDDPDRILNGMFYFYTPDAEAMYTSAVEAGATPIHEPEKKFYGDINAAVKDPFGNQWWFATHVEDVPPDELERRTKEAHKES